MSARFPLAETLTSELWAAFDGRPQFLGGLAFTGRGDLVSPFPVLDLAAASFGLCGVALADLLEAAGLPVPSITVDRRQSAVWFDFPLAPSRPLGEEIRGGSTGHGVHSNWMAEFETADGKWLRVQATYPTLRRRLIEALDCADHVDAVARAVSELQADEVEEQLAAAGAAAAVARTRAEWLAHPVGAAVVDEAIAAITTTNEVADDWRPLSERPLLGIRVLELTRVVAAPIGTRLLAALGAEVLRIDHPDSDEFTVMGVNDLALGKRWATLDIKSEEGRRVLERLIATSDVFVTSTRADALERLGLGVPERAALRPGLVDVSLNAYGWTGPWRNRRGFDTLVQYASGIADHISTWAREMPTERLPLNALGHLVDASRPRHLPVEALDFSTGYQVAAAAISGLARRVRSGVGTSTRLSLARTAHLLSERPVVSGEDRFALPWTGEVMTPGVFGLNGRATRRVAFPVEIAGVPLRWDRSAELPGSSHCSWSSADHPREWTTRSSSVTRS